MKAQVGDTLVLESHQLEVARRTAVIMRLEHEDGSPPYWVRWLDTGHEALFYPGPGCHVEIKPEIKAEINAEMKASAGQEA